MKRSKTSHQWMKEHVNDVFVKRARSEGYRSRAAYKLLEIAKRDKLLRPGSVVVDLGATPGGWSQVAQTQVGSRGRVFALDLLEMTPLPGVIFLQGDFREEVVVAQLRELLDGRQVDLVLSDMSPNISGIALSDQARAMHLAELALEFAANQLKPGGNFLVKVFQGSGFQEFFREMQRRFVKVSTRKPEASRGRSNELYLLGINCREGAPSITAATLT
jgi:23S rRNA (uridine2552-2'-O)-methyltransferase